MKTLAAALVSALLLVASSEAADKKTVPTSALSTVTTTSTITTTSSTIVVPGVHTPWPGRIFVTHDEWALSDTGFAAAPDSEKVARNLAAWFTKGRPGKFLAYSTNWSLTGQRLAQTLTAAGHTWTVTTAMEFSLANLLQYDAVFIAGDVLDNSVLIDYVRAGGGVYLAGGTAWFGIYTEAGRWNPFLNAFGLNFDYEPLPIWRVVLPVSSTSPLLKGVSALWLLDDYGMAVQLLDAGNPYTRTVLSYSGRGLHATYSTDVLTVPVEICPTRLPLTSKWPMAAAIGGSSTLDVRKIDPASLRLVGVAPRGTVYDYGATTSPTTLRLGKTTVSACLGGRGDGYLDLIATFEARDLVIAINAALGRPLVDGETVSLTLTGRLKAEFGGTPIVGESLVITKR